MDDNFIRDYLRLQTYKRNIIKSIYKFIIANNLPMIEIEDFEEYEAIVAVYDDIQLFKDSPYALQQWMYNRYPRLSQS